MKYFCVDAKTAKYVEVDETTDTSRMISKSNLKAQITEAQSRLNAIPAPVPDEELLAWARLNHPQNMNYENEKRALEKTIADNTAILENLK